MPTNNFRFDYLISCPDHQDVEEQSEFPPIGIVNNWDDATAYAQERLNSGRWAGLSTITRVPHGEFA